ncbi:helix-turn-helix domain-containing protein [Algoriphagus aquimarinus]|uniref:Helix-turn-helix domain-containing protein n=1 Tax=Algoriphagus aquimarinus TaxID=237018 RepID=A0A5C7AXG1_9BACT|nr:AraC family transcriptional regulator [Algoriphagus aquimarinus]TXE13446.1 helix-turn-helix domain-containing protein [Algoriphagus aquimarinus]
MENSERLNEVYQPKNDCVPEDFQNEVKHFNLFHLKPLEPGKPLVIPYRRRDFYKIMLVMGNSKVLYADKEVEIKKQALSFSNPMIPYQWEHLDRHREGVYCIFSTDFFDQFGQFQQYEVFQSQGTHVFELSDEQVTEVSSVFEKVESEFNSDYKYKYDLIKNLLFELIHFGLKLQPASQIENKLNSASRRIASMFLELLERQFPIDDLHTSVKLRTASDFAGQLNVHVNHLNRALREVTQKTTTALIAERVLQEAMVLLKYSTWNISDIAYALGFLEVTHFNNFFKKHTVKNPTQFRKSALSEK